MEGIVKLFRDGTRTAIVINELLELKLHFTQH